MNRIKIHWILCLAYDSFFKTALLKVNDRFKNIACGFVRDTKKEVNFRDKHIQDNFFYFQISWLVFKELSGKEGQSWSFTNLDIGDVL